MRVKAGKEIIDAFFIGRALKKKGLDKCLICAPEIIRPCNRVNTECSVERLKEYGRCYVQKGNTTIKLEKF